MRQSRLQRERIYMATETITRLVDDLDGSKADRTVSFSFEGKDYAIDLSKKNIAALEKALRPYTAAGRALASRRSRSRGGAKSNGNGSGDLKAIRDWARENGFQVSDRGRIGADVRTAYEASR